MFAYQGDQPWVTVVLAAPAAKGTSGVAITMRDGEARELGGFDPAMDGPVWGGEAAERRFGAQAHPRGARATG